MTATFTASGSNEAPILRLNLPGSLEAPSLARAAITEFGDNRGGAPMTLATLTLLVSETVTNAVVHPQVSPPAAVRPSARMFEEVIRVEVTDHGAGFTPKPATIPELTGAMVSSWSNSRLAPFSAVGSG